eukprot:TRINITY_DN14576_c0_g2_i1.p1 TRINITY_DN14576_c0_g2~~TRINITY_DN14576_c0_g2_i1.p1  ORF type:complete len:380 (+),score=115.31 TRINITY_DN14576_c0_g2_i1:33-1142(+)
MAKALHRVVKNEAFFSSASRKLLLQAMSWRPADAPEKAVLVLSHHYGDYTERLDRLGGFLAANGVALVAHDTQGWGRSESVLQYTEKSVMADHTYGLRSTDQLVADFDKLVTRVMQFYTVKGADSRYPLSKILKEKLNPWDPEPPIAPKIPVFVLGHGMGGPIVARFVADRVEPDHEKKAALGGCVLVAPWIGHTPPLSGYSGYRLVEEVMQKYFPYNKVMGLEPDPSLMFEDVDEVVAWETDTTIAKAALPPVTVAALNKISKEADAVLGSITVPVLVMTGEKDDLCPSFVGDQVVGKLASENKTILDIPNAKHDVFKTDGQTGHFTQTVLLRWMDEFIPDYQVPPDPLVRMQDERRREILSRYDMSV